MKFTIIEFDNDYRTATGYETRDFKNRKEAEEYCKKNSWTGYTYWIEEDRKRK